MRCKETKPSNNVSPSEVHVSFSATEKAIEVLKTINFYLFHVSTTDEAVRLIYESGTKKNQATYLKDIPPNELTKHYIHRG